MAERASALSKQAKSPVLETLALAFYKNGKKDEAIAAQKKAISLLPARLPAEQRRQSESRLKEYQGKQ